MPFGAIGGAVAGGLASGIGGAAVSSLLSPSASGGTNGSGGYYVPTGLGTSDTDWQSLLSSIYGQYNGSNLGQYGLQSLTGGLNASNIYSPAYQNAANVAGQEDSTLNQQMGTESSLNFGTQQSLLGAGQQVYQMALDPNKAQYNLDLSNLTQQTGATNSMYGLGSSAAGAGVQDQALANFGINWNTQQLQNAEGGLSAYTGAANAAGSYGQLATQQAASVPGYALASGQVPYQSAQGIAATPGQLGNAYGSFLNSNVYGPAEGLMGSIIPYMTNGNGAQQVPFQAQAAGAGAAGSAVSQGLSTAFNNYFNPTSYSGDFSTSSPSSTSGFYDPSLFGPSGYGGGYSYGGGGNSYGFALQ